MATTLNEMTTKEQYINYLLSVNPNELSEEEYEGFRKMARCMGSEKAINKMKLPKMPTEVYEAGRDAYLTRQEKLRDLYDGSIGEGDEMYTSLQQHYSGCIGIFRFSSRVNEPFILKKTHKEEWDETYAETDFPPLGVAVGFSHCKGITQFLEQGANIRGRSKKGCPIFFLAAAGDHDDVINTLLSNDRTLIHEGSEESVIDYIIRNPSSFSIAKNSTFSGGAEQRKAFREWVEGDYDCSSEVGLTYYGPLTRINHLAELGASVSKPDADGLTAIDKLTNVKTHIGAFLRDQDFLKKTSDIVITEDGGLKFDAIAYNLKKTKQRKITITYDFKSRLLPRLQELKTQQATFEMAQKALQAHLSTLSSDVQRQFNEQMQVMRTKDEASHQVVYGMHDKLKGQEQALLETKRRAEEALSVSVETKTRHEEELKKHQDKITGLDSRVESVEVDIKKIQEISKKLQTHINKDEAFQALLKATENHPRKKVVFNAVSKMFSAMGTGYRSACSGIVPRVENTYGDKARQGIDFLGNNVPAPFGSVFAVFSAIAKHVTDKREKARFYKIAMEILPRKLDDFSEAFSLKFIQWLEARYNGVFELNAEDALAVGQRALGTILKELHDLKVLNSEQPLDQQFLNVLSKSPFFIGFVETKLKASLDPRPSTIFFTPGFSLTQARPSNFDEKEDSTTDASRNARCAVM